MPLPMMDSHPPMMQIWFHFKTCKNATAEADRKRAVNAVEYTFVALL